jgi:HEAT repeat protein
LAGETDVEVIPMLSALQRDPSPVVRANALAALDYLGDQSAKPQLKTLAKSKDHQVAEAAVRALTLLRRFDHGVRP